MSNSLARPVSSPHPWIPRVRISGGYLDGMDVPFTAGANVICGGPGAGKSTFLELIRYCIGLPVPDARKEELEKLIATNLGAGRVHLTFETSHGAQYEISRGGGESAARVDAPKSAMGSSVPVADLFPLRFAGHGELEAMASDGRARLDLVARFTWDEYRRLHGDLARLRGELDANGDPLVKLDREIAALAKKHAALGPERARLESLKQAAGGDTVELGAAQARKVMASREQAMLSRADAELSWLRGEVSTLVATVRRRLGLAVDGDAMRGPNGALLAEAGNALLDATSAVEEMATRVGSDAARAQTRIAGSARALAEVHGPEDAAYRALLGEHEQDTARAFERLQTETRVADLEGARREHDARKEERRQMQAARDDLRAREAAVTRAIRALLEGTATRIDAETDGLVKVTITPEGDRKGYRAFLGELAKGKRFEAKDLDAIANSIAPDDLCAQVLRGDSSVVEDKIGSKAVALRFVSTLMESPDVYRLETVDLPDVPVIAYVHGKSSKPSETLSSGQRTVAFATILLLDRRGPLLIDQPEDNVANEYLAKYLCEVLADAQREAQLIFVTHNGNIPILGRAERVLEFESDGTRGWVAAKGAPSEVQAAMENKFEGGREAFEARKEFYGV